MAGETEHEVIGLGRFRPREVACDELGVGQVGYVIANIKRLSDVRIGDTITEAPAARRAPCPATRSPCRSSSAASSRPRTTSSRTSAPRSRSSRSTTRASRSSPRPPTRSASASAAASWACSTWRSSSSGSSARATSSLVQTAPNVTYEIVTRKGETLHISNPTRIPDAGDIEEFREPIARVNFILPSDSIGAIMQLCEDRRGTYLKTEYITPTRAILSYELPLAEMIYDLYDKLKSATRGYGTMDYEVIGYRASDLCRLDILVAGRGSTPSRSSSTAPTPIAGAGSSSRSSGARSTGTSSRWPSRPPSAAG